MFATVLPPSLASMINVTFSVDLSALERSVAKGASCGESQAASHIVLLLLWLFKAIESALWPSSAFNEGFLRPAHHQPRSRRGSRGAIALQILAGIEAKPSPLKGLGILPIQIFRPFYGSVDNDPKTPKRINMYISMVRCALHTGG